MKRVTVLLALVLAAGGVVACDVQAGGGSPAQAIGASPAPPDLALKAAVDALDTTAHTFAVKQGTSTMNSGTVDPGGKAGTITMIDTAEQHGYTIGFTVVSPDLWVKIDMGAELNEELGLNPTVWSHVDQSRLEATALKPVDRNGAPEFGVTELFRDGLSDVKRVDATHFSGTVDMTATNSVLAPPTKVVQQAGDRARSIPFTATVDDKRRLTAFVIDGASIDPELAFELTFAGFDAVTPVTEPAAVPATDNVYDFLN
ncbi:hypothetical protein ACFFX1_18915 [Dactylosporangium sucinum]|nr:hypothetical protein [Dactylosporangium sucinum]